MKYQGRLRKSNEGQQSVVSLKAARQETVLRRTSIARTPRSEPPLQREDRGDIAVRSARYYGGDSYSSRWVPDHDHYHDCAGGECACSCSRPYWSQSDICSDY